MLAYLGRLGRGWPVGEIFAHMRGCTNETRAHASHRMSPIATCEHRCRHSDRGRGLPQEEEYNEPGRGAFEDRKRQALAEEAQLLFPDEVRLP